VAVLEIARRGFRPTCSTATMNPGDASGRVHRRNREGPRDRCGRGVVEQANCFATKRAREGDFVTEFNDVMHSRRRNPFTAIEETSPVPMAPASPHHVHRLQHENHMKTKIHHRLNPTPAGGFRVRLGNLVILARMLDKGGRPSPARTANINTIPQRSAPVQFWALIRCHAGGIGDGKGDGRNPGMDPGPFQNAARPWEIEAW